MIVNVLRVFFMFTGDFKESWNEPELSIDSHGDLHLVHAVTLQYNLTLHYSSAMDQKLRLWQTKRPA